MPGSTGTDWLSSDEAARRMGITPRTLYRMIDEGHVPAYRMGRVLRLRTSDVDACIESCRVEPGTLAHMYPPQGRPGTDDDMADDRDDDAGEDLSEAG